MTGKVANRKKQEKTVLMLFVGKQALFDDLRSAIQSDDAAVCCALAYNKLIFHVKRKSGA